MKQKKENNWSRWYYPKDSDDDFDILIELMQEKYRHIQRSLEILKRHVQQVTKYNLLFMKIILKYLIYQRIYEVIFYVTFFYCVIYKVIKRLKDKKI